MFYSGSISSAMEEVQRTARPLFVFVVPADTNAPFGIADVFNWCAVGHYHLTGIVHIVTEGTTDFEQLNAVTPQKQVPRVHIIPHQPSTQLPPTCLFGSGITFEHVSSMVGMAGRPAELAVSAWEAELIQEGNRVTAEGNRTKRSQGQTMTAIEKEEAAAKSLRVSLRMAGAASSPPSSSSSSPVTFAPSVVVSRDELYAEAKRLAKGKAFHVSCGSSSASTPEEVAKMTLFNNAVVYVHINEAAEEPVKAAKITATPKVATVSASTTSPTTVGKRDRAESDPPTSSSTTTTSAPPSAGDDMLSIRITEGSGKQHNWDLSANTTVEQLFNRARAEILGGSSEVFNLVIAYPARRLGASDFAQVLGAGGLGLRGRGAMRLVPVVTAKPAESHADPIGEDGSGAQQGRFGAMASMVGGWLGGRTVAQPQPPRPAAPIPTTTRMNMADIRRNAAEREEEEAKKKDDDGSNNRYFNGVSTEFEGPPKKKDDDEKE